MAERKKVVVISEECVKIASKNLPLGGLLMYQSALSASGEQASDSQNCNGHILTLLTSEELEQEPCLPGLEDILCHTPLARDARVCKAEAHRTYLCGTIVTPRHTREQRPFFYPCLPLFCKSRKDGAHSTYSGYSAVCFQALFRYSQAAFGLRF